jgi:RecA-family ATPase
MSDWIAVENVSPIIAPDKSLMLRHFDLLFGRALTGRVEITAIHTDKAAHHGPRTKFFDCADLDEAADFAVRVNADPGWNVYVGAALRNEDVFPGKAADDGDFLKTYVLWADADDGASLELARDAYRRLDVTPPFIVVTGRTPSKRAQLWWPLDTPIDDINLLRASLRGIASTLHTDSKVCTGKQLMRLGGGINWPKKEDRILERTEVVIVERAAREFSIEQMHRAFSPKERGEFNASVPQVEIAQGGSLGLQELVMDGRETYAFHLCRAHLHELLATTGAEPTPDELYTEVAPIYLAKTDQARPGRGPTFLKQKCNDTLRAFQAGQIPFARNLDHAVETYAQRHREAVPEPETSTGIPVDPDEDAEPVSNPFRASTFTGEPPERRWVVDDWIVEGAVNSLYGDGGLGKTLLAQQLACSVSMGVNWLGLPTTQGSVLAVLCEDEEGELHRRHNDIKAAMGFPIGNPFSEVWLWPRVGFDNILVRWDRDGKPAMGPFSERLRAFILAERPAFLILDTLADIYGGNEIDRSQVNYFVKTILGGLIKELAAQGSPLTILLLGHPSVAGKSDGRGFSGSSAWNNSVRSRLYLSRPEEGGNDERVLTRGKANYAKSGDETAVRLFFADGVLHAQNDLDDGDSMLWAAVREVESLVGQAWRLGRPYSARKGHARDIFKVLPGDMQKGGFGPEITRQAIRSACDDNKIVKSESNGKSGYRLPVTRGGGE